MEEGRGRCLTLTMVPASTAQQARASGSRLPCQWQHSSYRNTPHTGALLAREPNFPGSIMQRGCSSLPGGRPPRHFGQCLREWRSSSTLVRGTAVSRQPNPLPRGVSFAPPSGCIVTFVCDLGVTSLAFLGGGGGEAQPLATAPHELAAAEGNLKRGFAICDTYSPSRS